MKIHLLTIGTRGDVQPFIALARGLKDDGLDVTLCSLPEFESLSKEHGIDYAVIRGDYLKITKSENKRVNPFRIIRQFKEMAKETLEDEWEIIKNTDILVYSPAVFGGFDIAEKLRKPSFAAFPVPMYSPTREFPCPFFPFKNLGVLNKFSYKIFFLLSTAIYKKTINHWRKNSLGLPPRKNYLDSFGNRVTKLYSYSKEVFPIPFDWDSSSVVTGYWLSKKEESWIPPDDLVDFIEDGEPPLYFGFGSMQEVNLAKNINIISKVLELTNQRAVVLSDAKNENNSSTMFFIKSIPFDWLFPKMSIIIHHGGAGTTGEALKAGKPTIICPILGDQTFWGNTTAKLGVGPKPIKLKHITAEKLSGLIKNILADNSIKFKAESIGNKIKAEDGVKYAVDYIKRNSY